MAMARLCQNLAAGPRLESRTGSTGTCATIPRSLVRGKLFERTAHSGQATTSEQHIHTGRNIRTAAAGTAVEVTAPPTEWFQKVVRLPAKSRGCHVITRTLLQELPELQQYEIGMANFFIQHTSASLTINENASPDVPLDLNDALDKIVPEGHHYRHLDEGLDDMPAHVKSSLMGPSLTIPVQHGRLALGTWQGVYLNEHRNYGGPRQVVVTVQGQKRRDGRKYGSG